VQPALTVSSSKPPSLEVMSATQFQTEELPGHRAGEGKTQQSGSASSTQPFAMATTVLVECPARTVAESEETSAALAQTPQTGAHDVSVMHPLLRHTNVATVLHLH
jgi:hypothetical protein